MAPKKKKRKSEESKPTPLDCSGAWGCAADDVAAVVDWDALTKGLDAITEPKAWGMGLTYASLIGRLPFVSTAGKKVPLLATVRGEDSEMPALPAERPQFVVSSGVTLREAAGRGRGWFATKALPAGTMILVERPLVGVLDTEWRGKEWAECDSADTAALALQLANAFSPSLDAALAKLHPPEGQVPDLDEDDNSDEDQLDLDTLLEMTWASVEGVTDAGKKRLPAAVRLNSLGFYTASEQLCHSGNFTALTGSGLFALGSGFNHSCDPSVARFSIGDVTAFVTNRAIEVEAELCISYVESEMMCAPTSMRRQMLNRDFVCDCVRCAAGAGEPEPEGPKPRYLNVDSQVQAQLSVLPPADRLEAVEAALRGEMGDDDEEGEESEEEDKGGPTMMLGKDAQELRVVQALAFMQMKKFEEALAVWRRLAAFACHHCPPFDEALAVYGAQASLCALAASQEAAAEGYASAAVRAHRVAFGAKIFRWRFRLEIQSSFVDDDVKQKFWKIVDLVPEVVIAWSDLVAAWSFKPEEIPMATEKPPQES